IELTASAAIVIAALSIAFGSTAATRIRSAAWLSAWFVLVVILAATRRCITNTGSAHPASASLWRYRSPSCAQRWRACSRYARAFTRPLWLLVGMHTVRLLGISFVVLYAAHRLPTPFAPVAGWGDIFVGATAAPIAWLAYRQSTNARAIVWTWNLIGIADLIAAVALGVTSSPGHARLIFAEPSS